MFELTVKLEGKRQNAFLSFCAPLELIFLTHNSTNTINIVLMTVFTVFRVIHKDAL